MPACAAAQPAAGDAAPAGALLAAANDYQLGVADQVRIIVFNEPTLSGQFTVNANGSLSIPLIGDVPASGHTATDVSRQIEARLRGGYVLEPKVSIDVMTFRPFYILGEVNKPGEYAYSTGLTVDGAVAMAEGFTYRAEKKKVTVRHAGGNSADNEALTPGLQVQPGDTIRIGERYW